MGSGTDFLQDLPPKDYILWAWHGGKAAGRELYIYGMEQLPCQARTPNKTFSGT